MYVIRYCKEYGGEERTLTFTSKRLFLDYCKLLRERVRRGTLAYAISEEKKED